MTNDFINVALNMVMSNPRIANNPQAQEYIRVIQSGDAQRGAQIADNLCKTYGTNRQDAIVNAKAFFHLGG